MNMGRQTLEKIHSPFLFVFIRLEAYTIFLAISENVLAGPAAGAHFLGISGQDSNRLLAILPDSLLSVAQEHSDEIQA